MIDLRNALMTKRLPYDAEVEYLESSGTQYIDTSVKVYNDTNVEITVKVNTQSEVAFIGSATSTDRFFIRSYSGSLSYGFGSWWTNTAATLYNQWRTLRTDVSVPTVYCDGTSYPTTNTPSAKSGTDSILIFGSFRANRGDVAVAGVKIWRGSTLVFDGIPVRKGTTGYLYDRVSGKLFGNAGSGDFVLGADVVPVEYIESHGTEYINTGVVATNSHGFRVDVATAQKSGNTNTRIFGVHEGNVRCGFTLYGTGESSGNDFFWGWNAASGFTADIPQRFVASLNYKNDRAAIFNGTTNLSSLGTLGNTTKSIYLLNANYNGAPFVGQYVIGRLYKAEISIGSDISNNFLPVRIGTGSTWEGAMMDTLTRRIYSNAGTGAFGYGNDLKYPIPAS